MRRYLTDFDTRELEQLHTDVLVVGSGIAGLYAALHIPPSLSCTIITKTDKIEKSNSWLAQGGIAAVISPSDNIESHIADTLEAGAGLCDEKAVRVLVSEGPENIRELIEMDIPFDTNPEGELQIGREGGHSCRRIVHCGGDATGRETTKRLGQLVLDRENLEVRFSTYLIDILVEEGAVVGALIFDGAFKVIVCSNILIATGGIGHLYRYTTNPRGSVGDGIAAAMRAGAETGLMEMVQFHPTTLLSPHGKSRLFLISEAVRGEGATLRNLRGEAFMASEHRLKDLAPRDIVTRAILKDMERTGDDHVLLDVSHMSEEFFSNRFPTIFAKCREEGINIPTQPIPIHPAQHYFMGGIKTDLNGMTSIDGLYAAGECACTGIHGANRLASNSMLECLVFGRRVARHIAASRRTGREKLTFSGASSASGTVLPRAEISARHELLRKIMSRHVGAVKTQKGLEIARTEIGRMREMLEASCMNNIDEFELLNMVTVAEEIVLSSLSRKTSIGAHYLAEEK
jgi:L-aspartate oxidase